MLETIDRNSATLYFVLAVIALILAILFWRTRQRKYAVGLGIVALLAVVVFGTDRAVESDREQIVKLLDAMNAAVQRRDVGQIFEHISNDFQVSSYAKVAFRSVVSKNIARVENFRIWDVEVSDASRSLRTGKATFLVRGRVEGQEVFYRCEANLVLDADNHWRLKGFSLFEFVADPAKGTPLPYPF